MKKFLVALLTSLVMSCASASDVARPKIDTRATVQLLGDTIYGAAACPISPTLALTAKHVAEDQLTPFSEPTPAFAWFEDGDGNTGMIEAVDRYKGVDLALMKGQFKNWVRVADEFPMVGDDVAWVEFDFANEMRALGRKEREGTVTRIVARHIIFRPKVNPGASGGCLLNSSGELIGIVIRRYPTDNYSGVGMAVGVIGFGVQE